MGVCDCQHGCGVGVVLAGKSTQAVDPDGFVENDDATGYGGGPLKESLSDENE